jgi:phosphopantetheinyl transferase (holo-ACP synthase)
VNGAHMANSASVSGVAIDGTWNFVLLGHEANGTQALARHAEAKAVRWADTEASLLANGTAAQAQAALEEMREFMLGAGGYEV